MLEFDDEFKKRKGELEVELQQQQQHDDDGTTAEQAAI
jgi:hypothetical protein